MASASGEFPPLPAIISANALAIAGLIPLAVDLAVDLGPVAVVTFEAAAVGNGLVATGTGVAFGLGTCGLHSPVLKTDASHRAATNAFGAIKTCGGISIKCGTTWDKYS